MNVASWPWLSGTKIVVLASGRSETVYFRRGSASGLINPGSPSKYRRITEPFLRNEGVNELSFLNWTRPDQDHSGAAAEIAKHFNIASRSLQTGLIAPVLDCELGSFEVLLLNTSRQQIEKLPSQTVDVIVVPSSRQCPYPELIRRFHPQAILYFQGKRSGNEPPLQSSVPIWFLGDKGAVTLALSDKTLELRSYLGDRFTLRSRSR